MFAYRLYVLVSLILLITILTSNTEYVFQHRQKRQTVNEARQYCGRSLSNTLQIICGGVYNSRFKKSNKEMDMDDYMFNKHMVPYKTIEDAKKMLKYRRDSRGVHEECCLKPCSTEEMRSYCSSH